jgi:hypothetical protein
VFNREIDDGFVDLVDILRDYLTTAFGAVWMPYTGKEKTEVVVDLGDGTDGGPGIVTPLLLIDKNGRGKTLDLIYIWFIHYSQELSGVRAKRLYIATLAFGVDGVVSHGAFARSRNTGEDNQFVFGEHQINVFEVVLSGSSND